MVVVVICIVSIVTTHYQNAIVALEPWSLGVLAASFGVFLICVFVICKQPQTTRKVSFMVGQQISFALDSWASTEATNSCKKTKYIYFFHLATENLWQCIGVFWIYFTGHTDIVSEVQLFSCTFSLFPSRPHIVWLWAPLWSSVSLCIYSALNQSSCQNPVSSPVGSPPAVPAYLERVC